MTELICSWFNVIFLKLKLLFLIDWKQLEGYVNVNKAGRK
jgi:hypothetical protein